MVDGRTTFSGGGRTGALLREFDWSAAPIGEPAGWPEPLRVSLGIVLNTNDPMLIWWGSELTQFYNDAFGEIAWPDGARTDTLATSGKNSWLWHAFAEDVEHVLSSQAGIRRERRLMRKSNDDEALNPCWSYSLTPIKDQNRVAGILLLCREEAAEQRSAQSREKDLIRIQQLVGIGGLEVDLTSGFRNWRSPEYLVIHGLPPAAENESHENWVRRIHPEDRSRTENTFIDAVNGACKGYAIQYRIIRPSDGKTRWISVKTDIERDRAGRATRLVGAHADVTDQIDMRTIERQRFTAALDLLCCAVILTDARGAIVFMNRSAEAMLNAGACIRSSHNIVRAARASTSRELSEALKLATHGDASLEKKRITVRLSEDDASPVVAHVLRLARSDFQSGEEASAVAAIFVRDGDDKHDDAELLTTIYELSAAESRLLACLLAGRDLSEAASELGIALSTVRTHLKVIFRKTGVNRQSELIRLALQLSAPV